MNPGRAAIASPTGPVFASDTGTKLSIPAKPT